MSGCGCSGGCAGCTCLGDTTHPLDCAEVKALTGLDIPCCETGCHDTPTPFDLAGPHGKKYQVCCFVWRMVFGEIIDSDFQQATGTVPYDFTNAKEGFTFDRMYSEPLSRCPQCNRVGVRFDEIPTANGTTYLHVISMTRHADGSESAPVWISDMCMPGDERFSISYPAWALSLRVRHPWETLSPAEYAEFFKDGRTGMDVPHP